MIQFSIYVGGSRRWIRRLYAYCMHNSIRRIYTRLPLVHHQQSIVQHTLYEWTYSRNSVIIARWVEFGVFWRAIGCVLSEWAPIQARAMENRVDWWSLIQDIAWDEYIDFAFIILLRSLRVFSRCEHTCLAKSLSHCSGDPLLSLVDSSADAVVARKLESPGWFKPWSFAFTWK